METKNTDFRHIAATSGLVLGGVCCLLPFVSPPLALLAGLALAVTLGNPWADKTSKAVKHLLALSVVGLGAGMNLAVVAEAGLRGFGYTFIGISLTLLLGFVLAKLLKSARDVSLLVSVGTAICGGSAIAAIAPVINARSQSISAALGTVFLLNAVALIIFPPLGHFFGLDAQQFGLWAALAIHDTSSVVGATMHYSEASVDIGTTVKLSRALWIVPLALALGFWLARRKVTAQADVKVKFPWFILGFVVMAAVFTYMPAWQPAADIIEMVARRGLVLTLFLIGANLTLSALKEVGFKPLLLGVILWMVAASATLAAILAGWIA